MRTEKAVKVTVFMPSPLKRDLRKRALDEDTTLTELVARWLRERLEVEVEIAKERPRKAA